MNITIVLLIVAYFLLCVGIGKWGDAKGRGFGVGFFASLVFSPVIGFILIAIIPRKKAETKGDSHIVVTDRTKLKLIRALSIVTISYAMLIWIDILIPPLKSDFIVVIQKNENEIHWNRSGRGRRIVNLFFLFDSYSISGQGRFISSGSVRSEYFNAIHLKDTIKVSYSPLFMKWKSIELTKNGVVILSGFTNDVFSSMIFSIIFLIPLFTFKSPEHWWDDSIAWIGFWISSCFAIVFWFNYFLNIMRHLTSGSS